MPGILYVYNAIVVAHTLQYVPPPVHTEAWHGSRSQTYLQVELVAPTVVEECPVHAGDDNRTVRAHEQQAPLQLPPPPKTLLIGFSTRPCIHTYRAENRDWMLLSRADTIMSTVSLTLKCGEKNADFRELKKQK